ncbi:hypothetical protein KALB_8785 [Kutzneria albida DSM 43870]|uniref:HTH luxR-type domain-containing protein n=1 Tax=Kutzneria albida DSM 43870 TaxID=1449976 RepID=W5WNQ4_9PSEU|nr:hypothetical protein KALB_8785 [Kutzneria albida DSM 43870]
MGRGDTGRVSSVGQFGAELAERIGGVIPHESYIVVGQDPVSGAGCFMAGGHEFLLPTRYQLEVEQHGNLGVRPAPIARFGPRTPGPAYTRHTRELMAAEGFQCALRISLGWGELVLLREVGGRPFSVAEGQSAVRLIPALAEQLRAFVAAQPLRSARCELPPGVVVLDGSDRPTAVTPAGRQMLRAMAQDESRTDEELVANLWNIACLARRSEDGSAISRIPTAEGWLSLEAQLTGGADPGEVVVTVQPASSVALLPAVSAWFGLTAREQQVVRQVLEGLPAKHIARRLELSPHTVNDHLKAIYRKTGVSSREELMSGLAS